MRKLQDQIVTGSFLPASISWDQVGFLFIYFQYWGLNSGSLQPQKPTLVTRTSESLQKQGTLLYWSFQMFQKFEPIDCLHCLIQFKLDFVHLAKSILTISHASWEHWGPWTKEMSQNHDNRAHTRKWEWRQTADELVARKMPGSQKDPKVEQVNNTGIQEQKQMIRNWED